MKQIAVLAMLIMAGVLAHGQTLVDAHTAKGVVSCEKRNWPFKDPVCDGYALAMAHQFYQEHPEYFESIAPKNDSTGFIVLGDGYSLHALFTAPDNPPLKCEKYQHEQKTPAHCAETCPPYGVVCTSQCLYVAADDRCVDDTHMVTEREWQEVLAKLKELQPKK